MIKARLVMLALGCLSACGEQEANKQELEVLARQELVRMPEQNTQATQLALKSDGVVENLNLNSVQKRVIQLDPANAFFQDPAPQVFQVTLATSQGDVLVEVTRAWSPHGADRFYHLVRLGHFDDLRFFRVVKNFVVQFGMSGDPALTAVWGEQGMPDDPVRQSNKRGYLTFAKTGAPNSRSTQLFINLVDNARLDGMGFAPFGRVVKGMEIIDKLYNGYGEAPDQRMIGSEGNGYLDDKFPKLDRLLRTSLVAPEPQK